MFIILLASHSTLTCPQCLCQSSSQTSIRCVAGSAPSTVGLLGIHAHCTVAGRWRRGRGCFPSRHVWSFGRWCRRCGLGLGCCCGCPVRYWRRGRSSSRRWRRWGWFGCWSGHLLLQIGFGSPTLNGASHTHTKPPTYGRFWSAKKETLWGDACKLQLTISFPRHDLHNITCSNRQFVGLVAVEIIQSLGRRLLGCRCARGRWWRRRCLCRSRRPGPAVSSSCRSGHSSHRLRNRLWRRCGSRLGSRLRQRLRCRSRLRASSQFRWSTPGSTRSKQLTRGDGSSSNLLRSWGWLGH